MYCYMLTMAEITVEIFTRNHNQQWALIVGLDLAADYRETLRNMGVVEPPPIGEVWIPNSSRVECTHVDGSKYTIAGPAFVIRTSGIIWKQHHPNGRAVSPVVSMRAL